MSHPSGHLVNERPERLLEYVCTVGIGELTPLKKDEEEPITRLTVIGSKDPIPDGFERIDTTLAGTPAALNAGAFLSPSLYLCVSRKKGEPPLTDIAIVFFDKDEVCPNGYQKLDFNLMKGAIGRSVYICYTRTNTKPAILDIALLPPKSGIKVPPRYRLIDRDLHSGSFQDPLFFCVKTAAASFLEMHYKPTVLDRFPQKDIKGYALPDSIAMFCHPEGIKLVEGVPPLPSAVSFVLTTMHGTEMYGSCINFYEVLTVIPAQKQKGLDIKGLAHRTHAAAAAAAKLAAANAAAAAGASGSLPPPSPSKQLSTPLRGAAPPPAVTTVPDISIPPSAAPPIASGTSLEPAPPPALLASSTAGAAAGTVPPPLSNNNSTGSGNNKKTTLVWEKKEFIPLVSLLSNFGSFAGLASDQPRTIYAPKTVCILSFYPYYGNFKSWLTELYRLTIAQSPLPLERYLTNLWETPLPRSSAVNVQLQILNQKLVFSRPLADSFPLADFDVKIIFQCLSLDNILLMISAMLNERKLILTSIHISTLTPVAEALRCLCFPFQWQYPFMPILPLIIRSMLDAPMPVFVGLPSSRVDMRMFQASDQVCVVDLDRNELRWMGPLPEPLPSDLVELLKAELETKAHISAIPKAKFPLELLGSRFDSFESEEDVTVDDPDIKTQKENENEKSPDAATASASPSGISDVLSPKAEAAAAAVGSALNRIGSKLSGKPSKEEKKKADAAAAAAAANGDSASPSGGASKDGRKFSQTGCRAAFLHFFIGLLGDYKEFLIFPELSNRQADSVQHTFDELYEKEKYLARIESPRIKKFMTVFADTQTFARFIEEKTYSSLRQEQLDFFDRCWEYEMEYLKFRRKWLATTEAAVAAAAAGNTGAGAGTIASAAASIVSTRRTGMPSLVSHLLHRVNDASLYIVPDPDASNLEYKYYKYSYFPKLDMTLFRRPRPVDIKYMREAALLTSKKRSVAADFESAFSLKPVASFARTLQSTAVSSLAAHVTGESTSPINWARFLLRCVYQCWFELQAHCISQSTVNSASAAVSRAGSSLATYAGGGGGSGDPITRMFSVFNRMTPQTCQPDEAIYRCLLVVCGKFQRKDEAQRIFETMKKSGIKPTSVTYGAYASALAEASSEDAVAASTASQANDIFDFLGLSSPTNASSAAAAAGNAGTTTPPAANATTPGANGRRNSTDSTGTGFGGVIVNSTGASQFGSGRGIKRQSSANTSASTAAVSLPNTSPKTDTKLQTPAAAAATNALEDTTDQCEEGDSVSEADRVCWDTLAIGVGDECPLCGYQLSEADIMSGWSPNNESAAASGVDPAFTTKCVGCSSSSFVPTLKISYAAYRSANVRTLADLDKAATYYDHELVVPWLSPVTLRRELLTALRSFSDDFATPYRIRSLHQIVFWNLIWYFSTASGRSVAGPIAADQSLGLEYLLSLPMSSLAPIKESGSSASDRKQHSKTLTAPANASASAHGASAAHAPAHASPYDESSSGDELKSFRLRRFMIFESRETFSAARALYAKLDQQTAARAKVAAAAAAATNAAAAAVAIASAPAAAPAIGLLPGAQTADVKTPLPIVPAATSASAAARHTQRPRVSHFRAVNEKLTARKAEERERKRREDRERRARESAPAQQRMEPNTPHRSDPLTDMDEAGAKAPATATPVQRVGSTGAGGNSKVSPNRPPNKESPRQHPKVEDGSGGSNSGSRGPSPVKHLLDTSTPVPSSLPVTEDSFSPVSKSAPAHSTRRNSGGDGDSDDDDLNDLNNQLLDEMAVQSLKEKLKGSIDLVGAFEIFLRNRMRVFAPLLLKHVRSLPDTKSPPAPAAGTHPKLVPKPVGGSPALAPSPGAVVVLPAGQQQRATTPVVAPGSGSKPATPVTTPIKQLKTQSSSGAGNAPAVAAAAKADVKQPTGAATKSAPETKVIVPEHKSPKPASSDTLSSGSSSGSLSSPVHRHRIRTVLLAALRPPVVTPSAAAAAVTTPAPGMSLTPHHKQPTLLTVAQQQQQQLSQLSSAVQRAAWRPSRCVDVRCAWERVMFDAIWHVAGRERAFGSFAEYCDRYMSALDALPAKYEPALTLMDLAPTKHTLAFVTVFGVPPAAAGAGAGAGAGGGGSSVATFTASASALNLTSLAQ